jgi:hypothetical protein
MIMQMSLKQWHRKEGHESDSDAGKEALFSIHIDERANAFY